MAIKRFFFPFLHTTFFFFITLTGKTSETSFTADWENGAMPELYDAIFLRLHNNFPRFFFYLLLPSAACRQTPELFEKPCGQDKSRLACNLLCVCVCIFCVPLVGLGCRKMRQQDNAVWLSSSPSSSSSGMLFPLHKRCYTRYLTLEALYLKKGREKRARERSTPPGETKHVCKKKKRNPFWLWFKC